MNLWRMIMCFMVVYATGDTGVKYMLRYADRSGAGLPGNMNGAVVLGGPFRFFV